MNRSLHRRALLRSLGAGAALAAASIASACASTTATMNTPVPTATTAAGAMATATLKPVTTVPRVAPMNTQDYARVSGTQLFMGQSVYRAIGANVPHLHQAYIGTWHHNPEIYSSHAKARQAIETAVTDAAQSKIAFLRFFANPGYPVDAQLYLQQPAEYWKRVDELFALCRDQRVKLVPSLGILFTWSLICGEPRSAILNAQSQTYRATRQYVEEFVTRYADDTNVLMWELENEAFLNADVNMQGRKALVQALYPPGAKNVREAYTLEDSLTFKNLQDVYSEFTAFIKRLDAHHPVTSGDADVRETSQSLRESFPGQVWTPDTLRQHLSNLIASQGKPLDVISLHGYVPQQHQRLLANLPALDYLRSLVRCAHAAHAPVFVGELGQIDPTFKDDGDARGSIAALEMLEQEGTALAALWVWHFPWQPDHTIDSSSHPALVQRISDFNTRYAGL